MNDLKDYRRNISENMVRLNSIAASRFFLNNLVTAQGFHIIYHRRGSMSGIDDGGPVDHYEIMSTANEYDDIYISIYNETSTWIPPCGYLFEYDLDVTRELLSDYDIEEINEQEITVDEKYMFKHEYTGDLDEDVRKISELPPLELFMDESKGVTSFTDHFPYELLKELFQDIPAKMKEIVAAVKPRT